MTRTDGIAGVAIVGCGTVGGATARILTESREILASRVARPIALKYIVDVDFAAARRLGLAEDLFRTDLTAALDDPQVEVVVETIGGTTIARTVIEQALRAGKHVVTANKALLAEHGQELMGLARKHGVCMGFEASCAGGIPIIRALCDGLIANRIDALYGIVNGTCNYILSQMIHHGQTFADALAGAQAAGLAEADPTLDVGGGDSAHKIAILASLAFAQAVDLHQIPIQGIDRLELQDVKYGQQMGYVVKLLAIARRQAEGLSIQVAPAFIAEGHPLSWVSGPFNAVSVYGHATGHTMYYGRGAGGMPTGSAVVADIVSIVLGVAPAQFRGLTLWPDCCPPARQLPSDADEMRYYLRVMCADQPGVLGQIASVLGRYQIGISSVLQPEPDEAPGAGVPVLITTHRALKGALRKALAEVERLPVIAAPSVCIDIVDEHPEGI